MLLDRTLFNFNIIQFKQMKSDIILIFMDAFLEYQSLKQPT